MHAGGLTKLRFEQGHATIGVWDAAVWRTAIVALPEQDRWIESACAEIDDDRLSAMLVDMIGIPSPTGEERAIAEYAAGVMRDGGLDAAVQPIDPLSANAIGRLGGQKGPVLLLFTPLDTPFSGNDAEEYPWAGREPRADLEPRAIVDGSSIVGLGAENPKAHTVSVISAVTAVAKAGIPLTGGVVAAFGAGGAPSNKRDPLERFNVGHGAGCEFLLQQGVRGDFAVIAKPGFVVCWEELGVCWFRIRIHGTQSYVGRRHVFVDDNPIVHAAEVIIALEKWFPEYTARHSYERYEPQAVIGAIKAGWDFKPSFTPAACDLYVDMRITPDMAPLQASRELSEPLNRVRAKHPELDIECELIVSIPGEVTDPDNWIVRSCIRAWEAMEGRPHEPLQRMSHQNEAVILRRQGIPTANIGLPAMMVPVEGERPKHTMGAVDVADMRKLTECLIRIIIDTCTRSLEETGISYRR